MAGAGLRGRLRSARFPLAAPSWPTTVERPDPERRVGLDYDHEWSRRYPVRLARAMVMDNLARPAARLLAPATVRGLEHLQHVEGPVIFASNHLSHMDTPLLLTTLPVEFRHRTVVAAASDYFFDRTWKAVLSSFTLATIPIERSKVNRKSGDTAAELVRGRLEPRHLPRRRALTRRLDPTVHRGRRLPGPAHGPAGRAGLPARHPPRAAQERRVGRAGARRLRHRVAAQQPRAPRPHRRALREPPSRPTRVRTRTASRTGSRRPSPRCRGRSTPTGGRPGVRSAPWRRSTGQRPRTGGRRPRPGAAPGRSTSHRRASGLRSGRTDS